MQAATSSTLEMFQPWHIVGHYAFTRVFLFESQHGDKVRLTSFCVGNCIFCLPFVIDAFLSVVEPKPFIPVPEPNLDPACTDF